MTKSFFFLLNLFPLFLMFCSCSSLKTAQAERAPQNAASSGFQSDQSDQGAVATMPKKQEDSLPEEAKSNSIYPEKLKTPSNTQNQPQPNIANKLENKPRLVSPSNFSEPKIPTSFWNEIFVQTSQPVGAYSLLLQWDPEFQRLKHVEGGNSPYFSSPPWIQEMGNNRLQISSFHGGVNGPVGEVSLCLLEWEGKSEKPKVSLEELTQVKTQQKMEGKITIKQYSQKPTSSPKEKLFSTGVVAEVWLETTFPLKGYLFTLNYDPEMVHIQSIFGGESPYFSSPPFSAPQTYHQGQTKISAYHGAVEGPEGKVSLCTIFFKKIQTGQTLLTLTDMHWIELEGEEQAAKAEILPETLTLK